MISHPASGFSIPAFSGFHLYLVVILMPFLAAFSPIPSEPSEIPDAFFTKLPYPQELDPQLVIIGPSRVQTESPVELWVISLGSDGEPRDLKDLPLLFCEGPRNSTSSPAASTEPTTASIPLARAEEGTYRPEQMLQLAHPGYYLFTVRDESGKALPFGLPVQAFVEKPALQLHWGDLHGHSTLSDGARPPEDYYRWARDVARLDCVALTDHNWALNDTKVKTLKTLATQYYEPGRFVPFFGFEWAVGVGRPAPSRGRPDHKNLLFRDVDVDPGPWEPLWKNTPTVRKLWEMLNGRDVIAIPHHTGLPHDTHFGTDWDQHSEEFERVVEIFSDWGSSETPDDRYPLPEIEKGNFVRDALARGYHLGFVGGSDTHMSRPGLNAIPSMGHPYPLTALTAIEAPERTREALFQSLHDRRCYATSAGRRHLVEFTVNNAPMGSRLEVPGPTAPNQLSITIAASNPIREILIVKNGSPTAAIPGRGWFHTVRWIDNDVRSGQEYSYYVRVEMEDTSMAWSSPVWVTRVMR